jgi:hypothetical protein
MFSHLNDLVAQQEIADRIRAAERARRSRGSRPIAPVSGRDGLIARLLVALRLRGAGTVLATADCADECAS